MTIGVRKLESRGYHVIQRLAVLIQYQRVTDAHTHRQTDRHTMTANTHASLALGGYTRASLALHG